MAPAVLTGKEPPSGKRRSTSARAAGQLVDAVCRRLLCIPNRAGSRGFIEERLSGDGGDALVLG